jgi:Na+/H+-dicarboxylate symporter
MFSIIMKVTAWIKRGAPKFVFGQIWHYLEKFRLLDLSFVFKLIFKNVT